MAARKFVQVIPVSPSTGEHPQAVPENHGSWPESSSTTTRKTCLPHHLVGLTNGADFVVRPQPAHKPFRCPNVVPFRAPVGRSAWPAAQASWESDNLMSPPPVDMPSTTDLIPSRDGVVFSIIGVATTSAGRITDATGVTGRSWTSIGTGSSSTQDTSGFYAGSFAT